jgi:guanylate kinase
MNKLIIVTAPSGAGKTTIVRHLLDRFDSLAFSVSATTRPMRSHEVEGKDYYFLSLEEFQTRVSRGEFLEWEEVYPSMYYGTLKSEIDRLGALGKNIIFDIDVMGALNIKRIGGERALSLFVAPPSLETLRQRLRRRRTESTESLRARMARAEREMGYRDQFDVVLINDWLEEALLRAEAIVGAFLGEAVNPEIGYP